MSREVRVDMAVSGNVRQTIALHPEFSETPGEEVVAKLAKGEWATSITSGKVIRVSDLKEVGEVIEAVSLDDVELTDFELVDEA